MPRKGNGYDPVAVVLQAVAMCKWSPEKFFTCAKEFCKADGFNARAAAEEFNDVRANRDVNPEHMVSPSAVAFSNWVLVTDIRVVNRRFHMY